MSPMQLFIPLFFLGTLIKSKSKKAGAVYDILWSVGILIWGIQVMRDGGRIALFGRVEVPPVAFIGVIVLIIASEIGTLVKTVKDEPAEIEAAKRIEKEKQAEIARIEETGEKLSAPCTLYIVHRQGLIGSANQIQLAINGRKLPDFGNGDFVHTELTLVHNRLAAECNGVSQREIEFNAPAGGVMRIDVLLKTGKGILLEENPNTDYREAPPGQKRVRPLKIGLVLWSISNFWCYLLGIVPLKKTLRAARHPFDDVADLKLRSARKWNLWMTGLLVLIAALTLLIRMR